MTTPAIIIHIASGALTVGALVFYIIAALHDDYPAHAHIIAVLTFLSLSAIQLAMIFSS